MLSLITFSSNYISWELQKLYYNLEVTVNFREQVVDWNEQLYSVNCEVRTPQPFLFRCIIWPLHDIELQNYRHRFPFLHKVKRMKDTENNQINKKEAKSCNLLYCTRLQKLLRFLQQAPFGFGCVRSVDHHKCATHTPPTLEI